jgi:hypothetical protein
MSSSRRLGATVVVALATSAALVIAVATFARMGRTPERAFPHLVAAAAPTGWPHVALPDGSAVVSFPPSLRRIDGDEDAVSLARVSPSGTFEMYVNATPRQGTENLRHWADTRLGLLRDDDASSTHEDAAAEGMRFLSGATGSCVIDDYVTRIGGNHYEEIACLVQGRSSASVIVATTPTTTWDQSQSLLLRTVASYLVR